MATAAALVAVALAGGAIWFTVTVARMRERLKLASWRTTKSVGRSSSASTRATNIAEGRRAAAWDRNRLALDITVYTCGLWQSDGPAAAAAVAVAAAAVRSCCGSG